MTDTPTSPEKANRTQNVTDPSRYASIEFWHHLLVVMLVTIIGLYYGSNFLIPLAVASMNFVLLTAIIDLIAKQQIGGKPIPRWAAQVSGLAIVLFGFAGIIKILASQSTEVIAAIPRYQERIGQILEDASQFAGEDISSQVHGTLSQINVAELLGPLADGAGSFLSGIALVLLYIPFMLAERNPMRLKMAMAAPNAEFAAEVSKVIQSISIGVQRYVGIKTLVSLLTGILSYVVMKLVGLDFAETWGLATFALNFIPTFGSLIAVAIPAIVALVQFESLTPFLIVIVSCGIIQFVIGNILEPSLTGRSLNLSPFVVILALTFWTTLWGIAGALLSVPITVCAVIVLSNIADTRPLAILMSGDGKIEGGENVPEIEPGKPQALKPTGKKEDLG